MRKRYVLLVIVIISVVIFNVPKSYANNKLDSVELKENNDINKKAFAMYVENSLGKYELYTEDNNYFPNSLKYHYNEDMSKCVDNDDQEVEGILKNNEDNSVTVTSNKTVYCYLYFDLDKDKPNTPIVTLSNLSSIDNNYTNSKSQTVTITYSDEDIESYCISLNDTCTSYVATGLDKSKKTITISNYDLGTDGNKTIKVWLKDMAGNISEISGSITKTLDTQPPVINNLTVSGVTTYSNVNYVTTASPSVTIDWTDDNVARYCMSKDVCTPGTNISAKTVTANVSLTNNAANTIHAKVMDKAGNVSNDKTYGLTVDTIAPGTPTVSINSNAGYTQSEKVNVNVTGIASDAAYYCTDYTGSCAPTIVNKNTSLTLSNQTITKTEGNQKFCVRIKDKAGNIGTAGCDTIYLDLNNPIVGTPTVNGTPTENQIVVKGTSSDAGGIKTVTCKNAKNVGTCTCSGTTSYTCTNSGLAAGTAYTITVTVTDNSGRTNSATSTSISTKQDKLNFDTKCGYRFDQAAHESSPTRTIDIDVVTEEDWYGNGWNCTVSCDKYSFSVYKFQSLGIIEAQYTVKSSSSRWNEFTFTMTCTDKNGIKGSVTKTYSPSNCSLEYDNSF